jgi:hypothetical protein
MKDYREWLKGDAGFRTIKTIRIPWAVSPLILAGKYRSVSEPIRLD